MFTLKILGTSVADRDQYMQTSGYLSRGVEVNKGLSLGS